MASIIKSKNLNPYYLVHPNCLPDLPEQNSSQNFCSVLLGDAVDGFTYKNMNEVWDHSEIVSCRGVVQLGDLIQGFPGLFPIRLRHVSLFYSLESSLVLKVKNTW